MSDAAHRGVATGRRTHVQKAALVVGAVFLLVGVLGFVPGITTRDDPLSFASHHSDARLLGLFQVSVLHNVVHLPFGVAGLLLARTAGARRYLIMGGTIDLVLFVHGLLVDDMSAASFIPVNRADDLLHLVLGLGMIALGAVLTRRSTSGPAATV